MTFAELQDQVSELAESGVEAMYQAWLGQSRVLRYRSLAMDEFVDHMDGRMRDFLDHLKDNMKQSIREGMIDGANAFLDLE